mmetsp:Transcript_50363/g.58788  ORF Transcript_50363/g.58788 Transcript_50363/m.58788 type:complete len:335 (+) Transcript_50363:47-1051(+)
MTHLQRFSAVLVYVMAVTSASAAAFGGPKITLNNGLQMPQLGLGTWKSEPGEVKAAVKAAVGIGYRHIDCAAIYKNEEEVGEALTELFAEGVVTRDELWITSKLWNDHHRADDVPGACSTTLQHLGLDYLDLYLIHWPVATGCTGDVLDPTTEETWRAMEALQASGKARSIGVSNFSAKKLSAMRAHAKVFPAVNQVELHPVHRQDDLLSACAALGTHVTAYSPLGSPDSAAMIDHKGAAVMVHPAVVAIADAVGKSPAQVLIRWAMQRGTSVVPKSVTPSRIEANFASFDWELSDAQMAKLSAIEPQTRMIHGAFWCNPEGPYRTLADLWDEL